MPPALRRWLPAAGAVLGVAVLLKVVYDPWYLNYDARYALLWAQDLLDGVKPEYRADFAPTPRPLQTSAALVLSVLGDGAGTGMAWLILLCYGALGVAAHRLGSVLFSPAVGVVTALVVLTRPAMHRDALLAYQDIPFALLIFCAVILEAQRPRRGTAVLAVLAVAGLVRPEAWALSGLYVLYLARDADWGRRIRWAALAASAPVIWAVSDGLITGDFLHSLHGTSELAVDNDRRRFLHQVPYWTAQYFGFTLREPVLFALPVGLWLAWVLRARGALLPLVVAAAMVAVFAIGPIFGLPLIGRYIRTPAMLVALFYGLAVMGWQLLPRDHAHRRRWMLAGAAAALASVVFLPWHLRMLDGIGDRLDRGGRLYGDLRELTRDDGVRAAFARCPDISAADHRPIPFVRDWLDGRPGTVSTTEMEASPLGSMYLEPVRSPLTTRQYADEFPAPFDAPEGWRVLYENRTWRISAAPGCT